MQRSIFASQVSDSLADESERIGHLTREDGKDLTCLATTEKIKIWFYVAYP